MLFIANIKREYFKLSLHNEQVKLKLRINQNLLNKKQFVFTGHKKAFKGISQGISNDDEKISKDFVFLDQVVDDEFEYNRLNADGTDNI